MSDEIKLITTTNWSAANSDPVDDVIAMLNKSIRSAGYPMPKGQVQTMLKLISDKLGEQVVFSEENQQFARTENDTGGS